MVPAPEDDHLSFSFNLCSNAFITYFFTDIARVARKGTPQEIIDLYLQREKKVSVHFRKSELPVLAAYNRSCVHQCFRTVYCSSRAIYGL
jgi:hypothetical protein